MADDGAVNLRRALPACALLIGFVAVAPIAQAESGNPLYDLVDTATQRLLTADPVAAFKWIDGGPLTDPARVRVVVDAVRGDAASKGIDQAFVEQVFRNQIDATESIEYTRFGQWKLDPPAAPTVAPDLSASRKAIDGFNREMVAEMAAHWDALHAPSCAADLAAARDDVVVARTLDPLYAQALAFATHSYCR